MTQAINYEPHRGAMELHTERDRIRWYWRLLGTISASLIMLGFLVFPASFSDIVNTQTNSGTISIVAVILLALGYSLSVALWFICSSWLFQFDVLFVPCLSSCMLGLLNIGISLGVHPATAAQWTTASISGLALALASTIIYAILSTLTYRKITRARRYERPIHQRTDSETLGLLPDDQLQRQQLLRLLKQSEENKISPAASQSTFRIDIPENSKLSNKTQAPTTYLAAPSNVYEDRSRSIGSPPIDEQFALLRGNVPDAPMDWKLQALEKARENTRRTRSRDTSRDVSRGPPVVVNRPPMQDLGDITLSEIHPLERAEFIRAANHKDEPLHPDGVYRPEDHDDYIYDSRLNGEGRSSEIELAHRKRVERQERGELEAEVIPRIVRVQTDGWPTN